MTVEKSILVIDDEPTICWAFEQMLREHGHQVETASSAEEGLTKSKQCKPDLIFLDVRLPKQSGIDSLPDFIKYNEQCPIVVMTAFGDLDTAVSAVRNGASDYLTKPFSLSDVQSITNRLLTSASLNGESIMVQRELQDRSSLIGKSPAMQHVFKQIALVASSDLSVLITGETGTGKELVAEAIHHYSHRSDQPYLPIAPVSFNEDLIESELFGHTKGSFTGAMEDRAGLFERAEGGTILLDEIGDLPVRVQIKLLRVLEHGHYTRVGDVTPRRCNVRIIAATHRDLSHEVKEESFRRDLFYRLNGLNIHLPPLRDRIEDIQPLCEHFLRCIGRDAQSASLTAELIETLANRDWPGNIRELRNSIEHAAVVAGSRAITIEDFPAPQHSDRDGRFVETAGIDICVKRWATELLKEPGENNLQPKLLSMVEPILIQTVLKHTKHNRIQTSELLGIHRGTLREKMRHYGMDQSNKDKE